MWLISHTLLALRATRPSVGAKPHHRYMSGLVTRGEGKSGGGILVVSVERFLLVALSSVVPDPCRFSWLLS